MADNSQGSSSLTNAHAQINSTVMSKPSWFRTRKALPPVVGIDARKLVAIREQSKLLHILWA